MIRTKLRPSLLARCRNDFSALCARVCVMPCKSSLASIGLRPRDSFDRSRRPSGASGGGGGTLLDGEVLCGGGLVAALTAIAACSTVALFGARGFFRNGLIWMATLSHRARSSWLSARRRGGAVFGIGVEARFMAAGGSGDGDRAVGDDRAASSQAGPRVAVPMWLVRWAPSSPTRQQPSLNSPAEAALRSSPTGVYP